MKIFAFFLVLMMGFLMGHPGLTFAADSYDLAERTVRIERLPGGALLISLEEDPTFSFMLGDGDRRYFVNGVMEDGVYLLVYGYFHDIGHDTFYDAFVLVLDAEAEPVLLTEFDFGELEEVATAFKVSGRPMFQLDVLVDTRDQPEWETHYVIMFAADYRSYQMVEVPKRIVRWHIEGDRVYLSDRYHGAYHTAIDAALKVYQADRLYGVLDQTAYTGHMHIRFVETAWLNDTAFLREIFLETPGHYTITYANLSYDFTLHPDVNGVYDGQISATPLTLQVSAGRAYLNHDIYVNGTPVERPGYHRLEIEGVNGYVKTLDFTITADVHGIYDMQQYHEPRTLQFRGVGYLNNRYIESGYVVQEPGLYTLKVHGENGYEEVHHFELLAPPVERAFWRNTLLVVEVGLLATAAVLGGIWVYRYKFKP
ncbi:MAG: hypothetical protein EA374_02835 [Acholeplasmatales bacterium]|nr:MAG: hypothetical protein EA374_02835 [Acholeplasmatales bacterium]